MMGFFKTDKKFRYLITIFVVVLILILLGSYLFFLFESRDVIKNQHQELKAIANLKIEQITQWIDERKAEASFFSTNEAVISFADILAEGDPNQQASEYFTATFSKFNENHNYENIMIINGDGDLLWKLTDGSSQLFDVTSSLIDKVFRDSSITLSDFYKDSTHLQLDLAAPIFLEENDGMLLLVFRINPEIYLFPLIQAWPTASKSAETLLFRKEGDSIVFLNTLRHVQNPALGFKIPMTSTDVPAIQGALGYRGIFEGVDYRDVKVLSEIEQVPGTNWLMIAKEDKSEIYKELYINGIMILAFTALSFVIIIMAMLWVYKDRQKNLYKKLFIREKELKETYMKLRATMDHMLEGCQIISFDWEYLYINDAAAAQGKMYREDMTGKTMMELYPGIENTEMFHQLERCMAAREAHIMENEFIFPDGSNGWFELSIQPSPEGLFILSIDITERKELEQQLLQAVKMESLGTLAGGIAHDFNNILGIILGHTNLIPYYSKEPDKLTESINTIKQATQRGADLVKQLLTFARKAETVSRPLKLNDVIDETVRLLKSTFPKNIEIDFEADGELPLMMGDVTQIQQVLINLSINARDALQDGGQIRISSQLADPGELKRKHPDAREKEYILMKVSDNGKGMSDETLNKIFEPFFTTKDIGKGTGLGLSLVYSIVKNHKGYIEVYSHPGKGTEFWMYFPVEKGETMQSDRMEKKNRQEVNGEESILIIEDESMIRDLLSGQLTPLGYKVITAPGGKQGIKIFQDSYKNIDLVILDLGLPELKGQEVFVKIKETDPSVRIIVASGFVTPEIKQQLLREGVKRVIQKPYEIPDMILEIRNVLDEPE